MKARPSQDPFPCVACPFSAICLPRDALYRTYPARVAILIDLFFLATLTEADANYTFDVWAPKMRCHSSIDYSRLKEGGREELG
jgi:hypothetical protein